MSAKRRGGNVVNFTQKGVGKLGIVESGKPAWYQDAGCEGLSMTVSPKGKRVFYLIGKLSKGKTRKKLGTWFDGKGNPNGRLTVEDARRICKVEIGKLAKGEVQPERKAMLVSQLFALYMEQPANVRGAKRERSEKTKTGYNFVFKKHIEKQFGNRLIETLTKEEVNAWHMELAKSHVHMANRCLVLLKCMYGAAVDLDKLGKHPFRKVMPYYEKPRNRWLQEDELVRFVESCENDQHGDFWLVGLLTGQRQRELLSMKWKDLSLENERPLWQIPRIKGGREGLAYISLHCRDLLKRRQEQSTSEWVFPSPLDSSKPMVIPLGGWIRLCKAATLIDENGKHVIRRHDLRRTLGSFMANRGYGNEVIGIALNHKPIGVTSRYAQLSAATVWDAVNATNNYMMGLVNKAEKAA